MANDFHDSDVALIIENEELRQSEKINMIASENYASRTVREAMSSCFTNKYAEGYPSHRYYGGCEYADEIEQLAIDRAKKLFGAEHANVQPHSGSQANQAVYYAMLEPGDTVLSMELSSGGHLSHGSQVNISGNTYNFVHYTVDRRTDMLDYEKIRKLAKKFRPKMIIAGASAYPRSINFSLFRDIADEVGALLMVDMAHIAGLVAAGVHESPVPYADVVTSTTHKTLRGPRGGFILCKQKYAKAIDSAVFPGIQGGPLIHVIAAKAVCFGEAMKPEFVEYQRRVVENAKALADCLKRKGFRIVTDGTDNHMVLIDLRDDTVTGLGLEHALGAAGIIVNKNMLPFDTRGAGVTSGVRIGTAAVTTRGMGPEEMRIIADIIHKMYSGVYDDTRCAVCADAVDKIRTLAERFPVTR